uniref:Uncharacterized protein n=1 Tax=Poecilia reticulata TaxID=8081 RepID=A0A3P9NGE8_POERE
CLLLFRYFLTNFIFTLLISQTEMRKKTFECSQWGNIIKSMYVQFCKIIPWVPRNKHCMWVSHKITTIGL